MEVRDPQNPPRPVAGPTPKGSALPSAAHLVDAAPPALAAGMKSTASARRSQHNHKGGPHPTAAAPGVDAREPANDAAREVESRETQPPLKRVVPALSTSASLSALANNAAAGASGSSSDRFSSPDRLPSIILSPKSSLPIALQQRMDESREARNLHSNLQNHATLDGGGIGRHVDANRGDGDGAQCNAPSANSSGAAGPSPSSPALVDPNSHAGITDPAAFVESSGQGLKHRNTLPASLLKHSNNPLKESPRGSVPPHTTPQVRYLSPNYKRNIC
jgi:hypothetical protein